MNVSTAPTWALLACAALAVLLVGAALWYFLSNGEGPPGQEP